ncbi:MAG: manganese efflux pump [Clostridia bacterium]|nr:manganese efflux pump [Clostridia bacterium]
MSVFSIVLIAIGLSMDAFAVSVCKGLKMKTIDYGKTLLIGLFFGGFQAIMPLIGWLIGYKFQRHIENIDHWIAFLLLAFIGGKMIYESFKADEDNSDDTLKLSELFILAIATSIDALAVGIAFAMLSDINIFFSIAIIGLITFILSVIGVAVGNKFGAVYKNKAELVGGIILILLGLKILLEHLGIVKALF